MPDSIQTVEVVGADYEHTMGLGGVIEGVVIKYKAQPVTEIFGRMISERSFEACEFSLSNYIMLKDRGADWIFAIPVFPNRSFRHNTLFVRRDSDFVEPTQLRGKKLGVEDYSMTAAVWVRGILNEEYGVDWRELEWYCDATQRRFDTPADVRVTPVLEDLEDMLVEGKLDAIVSFGPRDEQLPTAKRKLRRLLANVEDVERMYYQRTGIYPINHCVVIRKDTLDRLPGLALCLFEAYADSKARAYSRRLGATLVPWGKRYWAKIFEIFGGNPLPYGLTEANRLVIETLVGYLCEQKLIAKKSKIDALFVPGSVEFREA